MTNPDAREWVEVLVSDIEARPRGAPAMASLARYIENAVRSGDCLTITFSAKAVDEVRAFVEAERLCCAGIDWGLQVEPEVALTIGATPAQLDAIEQMLPA